METLTQTTKTYLLGHTNEQNALIVDNYPYGRLRTQKKYWIESAPKKGDRLCEQTKNPKYGNWNKPKKSTYTCIGVLYKNEIGHVKWEGVNAYEGRKAAEFINNIGGIEKLNELQRTMYNSLMGINEVKRDEFTGEKVKDYSIKWEKNHNKDLSRLIITFSRPDGVKLREIYEALKKLNKEKLNTVFEKGGVNICVRGGVPLGGVCQNNYIEYLASDENT